MMLLLGAGDVHVYFGTVQACTPDKISIVQKDGGEKSFKVNGATRVFVTGRLLPVTRIRPNTRVQVAVDRHDVALQIVVEEAPK